MRRTFIFFVIVTLFSSCKVKKNLAPSITIQQKNIPIFISMPRNTQVFENISALVYQSLSRHFTRLGYLLVDNPDVGYILKTTIKSLDPAIKYASPEVILLHMTMRLELDCCLLNFKKEIVSQKKFYFSTLISKPRNPTLNSDFLEYEYARLLERSVPRIEHFFRNILFKAFE